MIVAHQPTSNPLVFAYGLTHSRSNTTTFGILPPPDNFDIFLIDYAVNDCYVVWPDYTRTKSDGSDESVFECWKAMVYVSSVLREDKGIYIGQRKRPG